jgi:hypothetical protein
VSSDARKAAPLPAPHPPLSGISRRIVARRRPSHGRSRGSVSVQSRQAIPSFPSSSMRPWFDARLPQRGSRFCWRSGLRQPAGANAEKSRPFHLQLHHATDIVTPSGLRPIRAWLAHHLTVALCCGSMNTRRLQELIPAHVGSRPVTASERACWDSARASHLSMGSGSPSGGRWPSSSPPPAWL